MPRVEWKKAKQGQSLIEFAFCLIFLVLLVLGFAEFGMAFWTAHAVSNASREGARIAAAAESLAENDSRVREAVFNYLNKSTVGSDETVVTNDSAQRPGDKIKVTVVFPYKWITPIPNFLKADALKICRKTTMRYCPYRAGGAGPAPAPDRPSERPDSPDFRDWPDFPEFGDRPRLPGIPELPNFPEFGDRPRLPGIPELPNFPEFGDRPRLPGIPELPNFPEFPGFGDINGLAFGDLLSLGR